MPKLPERNAFFDISDYGRPIAKKLVVVLDKNTSITSIQLTFTYTIVGVMAIECMYLSYDTLAAILLPIKSMLDAADGEMARVKQQPSYTGRYLDSIFDCFINIGLLFMLTYRLSLSYVYWIILIVCLQLQGTIFHYFYVLKRHQDGGDKTSRVSEWTCPKAYEYESQSIVNFLHIVYCVVYGWQDLFISWMDFHSHNQHVSKKFMSLVSVLGLGFQLLVLSFCLYSGKLEFMINYILVYSNLYAIFLFII